jgi:hypothetical protein
MKWFSIGGCVLILIGFVVWRLGCSEVFSPDVLARLKPGMTTNEVAAVVGPPTSASNGHWVYQRPLMFNVGIVDFDSNRLVRAYND